MSIRQWLSGLVLVFCAQQGVADQCTQVFPGGLQSKTNARTIRFDCGAQLLSNASTVLPTDTIRNPNRNCGTKTCGVVNCSASGNEVSALNMGSFQTSSNAGGDLALSSGTATIDGNANTLTDYRDANMSGGTVHFSPSATQTTVYRFRNVTLSGGTVNFQPGDYWFNSLTISGPVTLNVVGAGTARIYVNNAISTGTQQLSWNNGGNAADFLVYGFGDITLGGSGSVVNGIIYAQGNVVLNNSISVNGAITANDITLNDTAKVTYNSNAVSNMDFGVTCPSVSQFLVTAPATGTHCQNMTVNVTAKNSGGQTVPGYLGQITMTTQSGSGTWVSSTGGGTLSSTMNGVATYQFVSGDNGAVSFQLSYPNTGSSPITIKAYQTNSVGILGLSGTVDFIPSGLLVTDVAVSNPPTPPPAAFTTAQVAGTDFMLYLTAYSGSSCGIVTSYTGAKTLRFWTTYVNPTTGTLNAKINGTNIASSAGATQTTQSITFTNGVATVTGNYPDVGQLLLNVADTAVGGATGVSGNFVVKPAQLILNIPGNAAAQVTSPVASAVSACLSDTAFSKAGAAFTVNVQVRNSLGAVTPNYGNETPNQGILLQSDTLLAPNPGHNGSTNTGVIGNGSTFMRVTGAGSPFTGFYFTGSTFYFDEVGCINLTAGVGTGSYLGAGNITASMVVGRFTPHHFSALGNTPTLTTGCSGAGGSFTYLDQSFLYATQPVLTVTAQALLNTTTQNYKGSFWKLANTTLGNVYNKQDYPVNVGDTIPALTLVAANPAPTFAEGGSGSGMFTFFDGGGFKIQRLAGKVPPPFRTEIQLDLPTLTDLDGVPCTGAGCVSGGFAFGATTSGNGIAFTGTGGGKQFYHGRLTVESATGAQQMALTIPMHTEFYTTVSGGNGFALNTLDSCTVYNSATNLILSPSSGISTSASLAGGPPTFSQGILNVTLTAPNPVASGFVDIEADLVAAAANLPWLQYNWPYSGTLGTNFSQNPRGRGTFGVFKGNDRVIYQQEIIE